MTAPEFGSRLTGLMFEFAVDNLVFDIEGCENVFPVSDIESVELSEELESPRMGHTIVVKMNCNSQLEPKDR